MPRPRKNPVIETDTQKDLKIQVCTYSKEYDAVLKRHAELKHIFKLIEKNTEMENKLKEIINNTTTTVEIKKTKKPKKQYKLKTETPVPTQVIENTDKNTLQFK